VHFRTAYEDQRSMLQTKVAQLKHELDSEKRKTTRLDNRLYSTASQVSAVCLLVVYRSTAVHQLSRCFP